MEDFMSVVHLYRNRFPFAAIMALLTGFSACSNEAPKIIPVDFTRVHVEDSFWTPRLDTNRSVTIPYDFQKWLTFNDFCFKLNTTIDPSAEFL